MALFLESLKRIFDERTAVPEISKILLMGDVASWRSFILAYGDPASTLPEYKQMANPSQRMGKYSAWRNEKGIYLTKPGETSPLWFGGGKNLVSIINNRFIIKLKDDGDKVHTISGKLSKIQQPQLDFINWFLKPLPTYPPKSC